MDEKIREKNPDSSEKKSGDATPNNFKLVDNKRQQRRQRVDSKSTKNAAEFRGLPLPTLFLEKSGVPLSPLGTHNRR